MTISRGPRARGGDTGTGLGTADERSKGNGYDDLDRLAAAAPSASLSGAADPSVARLMRVIEREIIPRLFMTHRSAGPAIRRTSATTIADDESAAFAEFVLLSDVTQIRGKLDSLFDRGLSLDRIYLDLVAPAARYLRELGNHDVYEVDTVSRGLARLRQVLGEIGQRSGDATDAVDTPGTRRTQ